MAAPRVKKELFGAGAVLLLCGLAALLALPASPAGATDAGALEAQLASARGEAGALAAGLQRSQQQLAAAQAQASAAAAHERRLEDLLAAGRQRVAKLSAEVARTRHQLGVERARLKRARNALARRLVAIYESGVPSTAGLILGSGSYQELLTRSDYLREIEQSDSALAKRVEAVRDAVHRQARLVAALRARAVAYDARLAAAHAQIATVRATAAAAASRLATVKSSREGALAALKNKIGHWVSEIRAQRAAEARAASAAEAEAEVGRWLGGPYAIPTYIVMCESGGNYGAVNPSSGAGGAYQILPSTWAGYGGKGLPQDASKEEQDRIAGEIWANSGPGAWVCG